VRWLKPRHPADPSHIESVRETTAEAVRTVSVDNGQEAPTAAASNVRTRIDKVVDRRLISRYDPRRPTPMPRRILCHSARGSLCSIWFLTVRGSSGAATKAALPSSRADVVTYPLNVTAGPATTLPKLTRRRTSRRTRWEKASAAPGYARVIGDVKADFKTATIPTLVSGQRMHYRPLPGVIPVTEG